MEVKTPRPDLPTAFGRFIGASLVSVTLAMILSLILSFAWNYGPAKLAGWPVMTWAESLGTLVSVWILTSPIRPIRVAAED
jgi:hypothetical protein